MPASAAMAETSRRVLDGSSGLPFWVTNTRDSPVARPHRPGEEPLFGLVAAVVAERIEGAGGILRVRARLVLGAFSWRHGGRRSRGASTTVRSRDGSYRRTRSGRCR